MFQPEPILPTASPRIYFNGFEMGFGSADIQITLKLDNSELMQLKASYTTAKTLSAMLNSTIATFEKVTKHQVMRMEEVGEAIRLHNQMESNTLPE